MEETPLTLHVTLTEQLRSRLNAEVKRSGGSLSGVVRIAIDLYLIEREWAAQELSKAKGSSRSNPK